PVDHPSEAEPTPLPPLAPQVEPALPLASESIPAAAIDISSMEDVHVLDSEVPSYLETPQPEVGEAEFTGIPVEHVLARELESEGDVTESGTIVLQPIDEELTDLELRLLAEAQIGIDSDVGPPRDLAPEPELAIPLDLEADADIDVGIP